MILITGHEGFIGKHVFKHFSAIDQCIGLDVKSGNDINICTLPECDTIIHLAGLAGVRQSKYMPDLYWQHNVEASRRIFQHAEAIGARVLYASSSSVVGWYNNPYATTKKVVEMMSPPKSLGMRFHTVYGRDSRPDMMYRMLLDDTATYITNHTRDFTHVDDVVSAIDVLYNTKMCGVVDIGTGSPVSVEAVAQAAGRMLPVMRVEGEADTTCANTNIIRSLGWKPTKHVLDQMRFDILEQASTIKGT